MSIIDNFPVSGKLPSVVNPQSIARVYFPRPGQSSQNFGAPVLGSVFGSLLSPFGSSAVQATLTPNANSSQGGLSVPGGSLFDGVMFSALASGSILFGAGEASTTGKVGIYATLVSLADQGNVSSSNFQAPNYQTLGEITISGQNNDGISYPWFLRLDMCGNTTSGLLQITKYGQINGTVTAPTTQASLTGVDFSRDIVMQIVCGVTFGATNSGNAGTLNLFSLVTTP
jgi:hypothetical protein